jgi:hypothetical protein
MDEKKQDVLLNGLNDDIQFQLLNTDASTSASLSVSDAAAELIHSVVKICP